jgi:hypothetical protein
MRRRGAVDFSRKIRATIEDYAKVSLQTSKISCHGSAFGKKLKSIQTHGVLALAAHVQQ